MRGDLPSAMEGIWRSGDYTGAQRPMIRLVVEHPSMKLHRAGVMSTFTRTRPAGSGLQSLTMTPAIDPNRPSLVGQCYADFMFTPNALRVSSNKRVPKELPNLKSMTWDRTTDADGATCNIELWNTDPLPIGSTPTQDLDRPGFYTYNYGTHPMAETFQQIKSHFHELLMPDNVIRSYEGYGFDATKIPEKDPNLVLTGVWKIDDVQLTATGSIQVTCRDMSALLLDQQGFIPVVPEDFYPLTFANWDEKFFVGNAPITQNRVPMTPRITSNIYWLPSRDEQGRGNPNIACFGHTMQDGFSDDPSSYWLSIANSAPARGFSYEYIEGTTGDATVSEVRFRTAKAGYSAFVSVMVGGQWQGEAKVQWRSENRGINNSDIAYVAAASVVDENEVVVKLPRAYQHVQRVRLTLGNLQNFGLQGPGGYVYRAGVRTFAAYGPESGGEAQFAGLKKGPAGANPSRYSDYTDIIKLLCAWAGFYWGPGSTRRLSDGSTVSVRPLRGDPVLAVEGGRVWGDFQETGTSGPEEITLDVFDKKPLMDGVNAIRDIIGYLFFIGADGGVVWRLPNFYKPGNWISGGPAQAGRTNRVYTIDDRQVIISYDAALTSRSVRDAVYVGDVLAKQGAVVPGFNPNPVGLRRVAGYLDQNFASDAECRVMADMITVRQMFQYRTGTTVVPGFPGIEIDDQVRLNERTTGEAFLHYVKGVAMSFDAGSGEYTYTLQHHWLGDRTYDRWIFDPRKLSGPTQAHLSYASAQNPFPVVRPNPRGEL